MTGKVAATLYTWRNPSTIYINRIYTILWLKFLWTASIFWYAKHKCDTKLSSVLQTWQITRQRSVQNYRYWSTYSDVHGFFKFSHPQRSSRGGLSSVKILFLWHLLDTCARTLEITLIRSSDPLPGVVRYPRRATATPVSTLALSTLTLYKFLRRSTVYGLGKFNWQRWRTRWGSRKAPVFAMRNMFQSAESREFSVFNSSL